MCEKEAVLLKALHPAVSVPARPLALLVVLVAVLTAACGGGETPAGEAARDAEPTPPSVAQVDAPSQPASGVAASQYDFPTGPAVTVAAGYAYPEDHIPSTGAYLPVNGQPTVVFVDAIW